MSEFELISPPDDNISSLRFSPSEATSLLVSSWDSLLRLYQIDPDSRESQLSATYHHRSAILDCCFSDGNHAFTAGLDGRIGLFDLHAGNESTVGLHDDAVRRVLYNSDSSLLISGSWDKSLKLYDSKSGNSAGDICLPEKVYTMATVNTKVIVGMANRKVYIFDTRNFKMPLQKRESSLKFMTRTIECMPNGEGYISTSVEGRVAVEFFDPSPDVQAKKYAFKCHRQTAGEQDIVYPVNAIAFHPKFHTFLSGGGDGTVSVWDYVARKRMRQLANFDISIAALGYSHDGRLLAYGLSSDEDLEGGPKITTPKVVVRILAEEDTKGKGLSPG
ncbi:Mitotic checkpoint protein BUB3 [Neolecta irregularis DAH-3]|uniref:Mitotic checkpoint protein BUB3 n=1 Tax=Neolecta irregularis (strain DAH-3) TaxID=1198029 RepID=A0A1U7LHC9_NEOID|nr:Mitotic checkpoint protein BUB3 [Neolecta irregularis DAH-3]|eukprot:OLL22057.1 Mitotic checkpoint protein BUB3 [Neolecta irregularis DAH-3]